MNKGQGFFFLILCLLATACSKKVITPVTTTAPKTILNIEEIDFDYFQGKARMILRDEYALAPEWSDRAIDLAERLDDDEALVHVVGSLDSSDANRLVVRAIAGAIDDGARSGSHVA